MLADEFGVELLNLQYKPVNQFLLDNPLVAFIVGQLSPDAHQLLQTVEQVVRKIMWIVDGDEQHSGELIGLKSTLWDLEQRFCLDAGRQIGCELFACRHQKRMLQ